MQRSGHLGHDCVVIAERDFAAWIDRRDAAALGRVFVCANFRPGEWLPGDGQGYLRSVCEHAAKVGVGLGGPDLLPFRKGQQNHCLQFVAARKAGVVAGLAVHDGNPAAIDPETGMAAGDKAGAKSGGGG